MRLVVTPFVDETYPNSVAFLAIHLSDGYQTTFGNTRRNAYYPGSMTIPQLIFDGGVSSYIGYTASQWELRVDDRLAQPTDITIDIIPTRITPEQWTFTADVCMEPTGTARTVGVNLAYTVDDYPGGYSYTYRKTVRNGGGPEVVEMVPGECVQVDSTFNFTVIEMDRWPTVEVVAWAQTPASGWGEAYQAAKLSMTLHGDGFESGDFGGGWVVGP